MSKEIELTWEELEKDLIEYGVQIPNGCEKIGEYLRNNNIEIAVDNINNLLEGLNWIIRVKNFSLVENIEFPLDIVKILQIWADFNGKLAERNYDDAADILEYEFVEEFAVLNKN